MHRVLFIFICSLVFASRAIAVDLPLIAIDGSKTNLNQYQGKWVVVNYWASWCLPCIAEMPELQSFHDDNFESAIVIGINTEAISKRQLESFLDSYLISYPIFVTNAEERSEIDDFPGLPTTFLVAPDGTVVARQLGPVTRDMIEKFILNWQSP
jgi:thiol-disulfide isomerase/thioredoxin